MCGTQRNSTAGSAAVACIPGKNESVASLEWLAVELQAVSIRSPGHSIASNVYSIILSVQASSSDNDLLSQVADVCRWFAVDGPPTAQRQAAALAELAQITAGRTDLLAQYAGQSLAVHDTGPGAAAYERAVQLCITAGADMSLIDRWIRQSGYHRAANPIRLPHQ
jgi:hypothetical protein